MHEWAIAESIVSSLEEFMKKHGIDSVEKLVVYLGELQNIDDAVLKQAIEIMFKENNMVVKAIDFRIERAVFRCRRCSRSWSLAETILGEDEREAIHFIPEAVHSYVRCPSCGSRDFDIVSGRGVRIELYTLRTG